MSDRAIRGAGAAGIVFVILVAITIAISGSPPMADDAVNKIRDYYVESSLLAKDL